MNIKTNFVNDLNNKLNLNPNFDDIRNKINVFQYIKEENKNTNLFNLVKTNKTYKIAGLSALAVVLSLGVVLPIALSDYNEGDNSGNVSGGSNIMPEFYSLYDIGGPTDPIIFSNLKVLDTDESLYHSKTNKDLKFFVVRCEVVEDFYKELEEKTIVHIPIIVYGKFLNIDVALLKEWLLKLDSICVYGSLLNDLHYDYLINENDSKTFIADNILSPIHFDSRNIIPILDGIVDYESMRNVSPYSSEYTKFEYFNQDMEVEVLFDNLRRLYQEQIERNNYENVWWHNLLHIKNNYD